LAELRQELRGQAIDTERIDEILQQLQALERDRTFNDPAEVRRLQEAAIEGLKEFEYALRRELRGDEEGRLYLSGSQDVPSGFRELVEEYYRELSRDGRRP
jgi:hypothetical protein